MSKNLPILFTGQNVRLIRAGRKTETRRLFKPGEPCRFTVGDQLWVRESWRVAREWDHMAPRDLRPMYVEYCADGVRQINGRNRPSMFMTRWASRITLEVIAVRTEPLHEITDAGAIAEDRESIAAYSVLWDSINHKIAPWASNPTVRVIVFRML